MLKSTKYSVGVINITVQPHTPEKYISLFRDAFTEIPPASRKYRGNEYIALKALKFITDEPVPYVRGIVYKYTKIADKDWFDSWNGTPLDEDGKPDFNTSRLHPNLSSVEFCFFPNGHRMFIVTKHKQDSISLAFFAKALTHLLNQDHLQKKYGEVSVSVETDAKALDAIQRMDIEKLIIRVTVPNDDDLSNEKQRFIERLKKQNSRRIDEQLTAEKGMKLKPDEETIAHMELALSNGFIIASGREDNERVVKKTSESPIEYHLSYEEGVESLWDNFVNFVRNKLSFFTNRQKK